MGRKHDLRDRCTKREMPDFRGVSFESEGGLLWCTLHDHHKKAALWQNAGDAYNLDTEYNNNKTSLITVNEDFPLVVAIQPPQLFSFRVWYNSFSSADIHGMNANMVQIANQQNSIEIKKNQVTVKPKNKKINK